MSTFIQIIMKCLMAFLFLFSCFFFLSDEMKNQMKFDLITVLLGSSIQQETSFVQVSAETVNRPIKVYLYNTHQSEEYIDGVTVYEVTSMFAQMLRSEGVDVVFETADFLEELSLQNKKYNQLYTISRVHLEDALVEHGPFDLILDVHRDSTSRSVSVVEQDGIEYARLMFVIGEKSSNASDVRALSSALSDKMNHMLSGIMREPFSRQSVYNQDMVNHMLLLEVGSDQNTSSEALRSLRIFVQMLKREGYLYDGF